MSAVAETTGLYVYGVVAAEHRTGVEPATVEEGTLAALVAAVPLAEFGEEALSERLNDRAWLEAHVVAHQEVLAAVASSAPVVPFRFGTIFRGEEEVRAMLRARADELTAALERVRGRVEVGVKAWAAARPVEPPSAPSSAAAGRSYLEQRLDARQRAETDAQHLGEVAREAFNRLLRLADDGVANRPQPPELSGRQEAMILNAAFLVADPDRLHAEVEQLAEEYRAEGISFELTGPWPAYNFVAVGEET